jgi:hypothetical protein
LRPFDLAYALSFRGLWDGVVGAHADRLAHADELLQLCATHGIAAFQPTAALHKAFAIGRLEGPDMALALVQEATDRLRDLGIRLWMGPNLGDQASFKLLLGDVAGALLGVDEAIACATRSFQIILPRLHRLRAEILARTPGSDPADVQAALSLARAVTEAQGSMFFAQEAAQGVGGPLSWSLPICVVSRAAGDYSSMNSQSVSNSPKF